MKFMSVMLVSFALLSNVYGQSYNMKVKLKNGNTINIPVDSITKIAFSDLTYVKEDNLEKLDLVNSFFLIQNYPNPFNPNTTISYKLPKSGNIEIKIFDPNGKCIKTLFDRMQTEGTQSISWDSRDDANKFVASGLYFYQIKFNGQIINKKMLLLR